MKLKKSVLGLAVLASMLTGCKNFFSPASMDSTVETHGAADLALLQDLATQGYVDYRIARFFALTTLDEFTPTHSWQGATLAAQPLVIYNSANERPRYYEFRVIQNGKEVGAIACIADKEEGEPVQYVMPFAKQVGSTVARSVAFSEAKFIDTGYPSRLVAKNYMTGRSADAITGKEETDVAHDIKVRELLETATPEMLEELGITTQELYDELMKEQLEEETRIAEMWDEIEKVQAEILAVTDEEVLVSDTSRATVISTSTSDFYLKPWYDKREWTNPGGDCGCNALTFITLGLGDKSGCPYVPLSNNSAAIMELYRRYVNTLWSGAKGFVAMSVGLSKMTDYHLFSNFFHRWDYIVPVMRNTGMPVVSLRSSIIGKKEWAWHYRTIIGAKTETVVTQHKFLWKKWNTSSSTDWYFMHDNGVDGKNFWEKRGKYYQLWSAHVVKK
ncbi:MAG: hypothetical protein J6I73_07470 [Treponema sp.]|nr:hypothetical protein [Treponema sp.]